MTNGLNIFGERVRISPALAERIKARWGVVHAAAETVRSSAIVEHGTSITQPLGVTPETTLKTTASPAAGRETREAAQVGNRVFGAEAYREQREQVTAEAENIGQQRFAQQARMQVEAAHSETLGVNHEYDLPA